MRRPATEDLYLTTVLPARLAQPLAAIMIECPRPREHQHQSGEIDAPCHGNRVHGLLAPYGGGCAIVVHADAIDVRIGPGPVALDRIGQQWLGQLLATWGSPRPSFAPPSTIELSHIAPAELRLVHAQLVALLRRHLVRRGPDAATPITLGMLG